MSLKQDSPVRSFTCSLIYTHMILYSYSADCTHSSLFTLIQNTASLYSLTYPQVSDSLANINSSLLAYIYIIIFMCTAGVGMECPTMGSFGWLKGPDASDTGTQGML